MDPDQISPVSLTNSVDPDQTARSSSLILVNTICQKQSDLGPQCLSKREISANNTADTLLGYYFFRKVQVPYIDQCKRM